MVERATAALRVKGTGKGKINELVEQPTEGEKLPEVDGNGSSPTDHQPPMTNEVFHWPIGPTEGFEL